MSGETTDSGATSPVTAESASGSLVGQVVAGRYRIDDLIGEGGMGAVYGAAHLLMHKRVAMKILHPSVTGHAEIVERFQREAIAGAHIAHPNVASAIDFGGLEDGSHYLVLEFVEGQDLRSVIAQGALAPARAIRIANQLASALRAAHQIGIVHRDLKPENVMLVQKEGEPDLVKLLDFGIAKVPVGELTKDRPSSGSITRKGMVYGTPEYIAPEQAAGEEIDARADLYSLGVVLYEMLCGSRPFDSADKPELFRMITESAPPPLASRLGGVSLPLGLEAVVVKLLEKKPGARMQTADELVTALETIAARDTGPSKELALAASATAPTARPPPPPREPATAKTVANKRSLTASGDRHALTSPASAVSSIDSVGDEDSARARQAYVERVVAALPKPLSALPPPALFAGAGLLALLVLVITLGMSRAGATMDALEEDDGEIAAPASSSPGASTTAPVTARSEEPRAAGPKAPDAELDDARAQGLTALGPLAQRYPTDPAVLKALLLAHAAEKSYVAAMGVAKRLFDAAPEMTAHVDVRNVIMMAANGPPDAAAAAFEVMATHMGQRGPDLLFDLASSPTAGKYAKDRASALLQDPAVRGLSSSALVIANDLRLATPCGRKALFARARDDGDARALAFLTPLLPNKGCGFFGRGDCNACLGNRADLREAIDAIQGRQSPAQ